MITQWKPDFEKWYNVDKEAYKFIFDQAEKRFEDISSESESITNKSIKMLTAVVAMFAFFVGFVLQKKMPIGNYAIFIGLFVVNVVGILFLIFPKEGKQRGIPPKTLIPSKLDTEVKEHQGEMLYYSAIVILQENIRFMLDRNKSRGKLYLISLIVAVCVFVSGVATIVISLY